MIVQFTTTNFKSIRNTADFSLMEANITEFPEKLIRNTEDGLGVLPVALLYGANGSGKSTVLEGIVQLKHMVLEPETALNENHAFYGADHEPTGFDIIIRNNEHEYEYALSTLDGNVTEETLFGRALSDPTFTVIFDRDREGVFLGEGVEHIDVSPLKDDMLMLDFVKKQMGEHPQILELEQMLQEVRFTDCSALDNAALLNVLEDPKCREMLMKALDCVQSGITDLTRTSEGILVTVRDMQFPMEEMAKGQQQMIRLFALAVEALVYGRCLLLDDVNQKLHPKAFRFLLEMFTDQEVNTTGAQLLGTSYDMPTMANSVLRRDEIWITAANAAGETRLYPLAMFLKENGEKVRKDETYFKQFLEGRYGTDVVPASMH